MRILFLLLASTLLSLAGTQSVTVNNGLGTNVPVNQLSAPTAALFYAANPVQGGNFAVQQGPLIGVKIVCIGDSIVSGSNGNGYAWPGYLQASGVGSSCSVYNLGLSGFTEIQIATLYNTTQAYSSPPVANAGTYSPASLFSSGAYLLDEAGANDVTTIAGSFNALNITGSSNGTSTVTVSSTSGINAGVYIQSVSVGTFTNNGTQPADGGTVTLGGIVYRFKSTMAQAYDVQIGASAAATVQNLIFAINGTGTAGANWFAGTIANQVANAGTISGTTFLVTSVARGSTGDSIATTVTATNCSWSNSTLLGGSVIPYQTTVVSVGTGNVVVSNVVPTNASLAICVSTETLAQFQTAAKSIWTNARASGYKIGRIELLPRGPQLGPLLNFVNAQVNTWLSQQSFAGGASPGWDYYFTPSVLLSNPLDPNYFGTPGNLGMGLHPNQQGYQMYGAYINQQLLPILGSDFSIYPFTLNGIPSIWLPTNAALTDGNPVFTTPVAVGSIAGSNQSILTVDNVLNVTGSNLNVATPSLNFYGALGSSSQINFFLSQYAGTPGTTRNWYIDNGLGNLRIINEGGDNTGLIIPASPSLHQSTIAGGWVVNFNQGVVGTAGSLSGLTLVSNGGNNYSIYREAATTGNLWFRATTAAQAGYDFDGNVIISAVGKGLQLKSGTNARIGSAVEVGGTIVVADTSVVAGDQIYVSNEIPAGTVGCPYISSRTNGTGFTITSTSALDTSTVSWVIIHKN